MLDYVEHTVGKILYYRTDDTPTSSFQFDPAFAKKLYDKLWQPARTRRRVEKPTGVTNLKMYVTAPVLVFGIAISSRSVYVSMYQE